MKRNVFDKMSESYENHHFKDTELHVGSDTLYVSPKVKLVLGWSLFILCCILAYAFIGNPFQSSKKEITQEDKQAVLETDVDEKEEHDTIIPYEKDDNEDLNTFIEDYFLAMTECNIEKLQDMVTDSSKFSDEEALQKKAEFITSYDNLTVYTKEGLDEGSYIAFVVSNLTITGVNSSPYDIVTLYIVTGAQGFRIQNGELPEETQQYINKVKGDEDIQKVFQSVADENKKLAEKDTSLQDFYDIISRRDVETTSGADQISTQENNDNNGNEDTGNDADNAEEQNVEGNDDMNGDAESNDAGQNSLEEAGE